MRKIKSSIIVEEVAKLCIDANCNLSSSIYNGYKEAKLQESDNLSKDVLEILIENADIAKNEQKPICQDTGMAVVFIEIGNKVVIEGDLLEVAINKGVAKGYEEGYLRKSVVKDPIRRENTKDNTPAVIHYNIVEGDKLKIVVAPKGFGSENMSALKMLMPSDGIEGVKDVIINTVKNAGANPCPPIIVGVGIGGTMEKSALLAKEALLREVGESNKDDYWKSVEEEMLQKINKLNIGVGGFGGMTTALSVNINTYPTHIAGLPVAVNIGCHVTRHSEIIL